MARNTYAHIAASYGIHESNLYILVKWVEDVLIKGDTFSPPGKKVLFDDETDYDIVLLDDTEADFSIELRSIFLIYNYSSKIKSPYKSGLFATL